jgi:hypothetical protein
LRRHPRSRKRRRIPPFLIFFSPSFFFLTFLFFFRFLFSFLSACNLRLIQQLNDRLWERRRGKNPRNSQPLSHV